MRKARGLYIISVAAQLLNMHPQTLRKYERAGFIEPPRLGTLRLYSEQDIARLRLIKYLVVQLGLNLSGVQLALKLAHKLAALRAGMAGGKIETDGALREIDEMLLDLGLRVDQQAAPDEDEEEGEEEAPVQPGAVPSEAPTRTYDIRR